MEEEPKIKIEKDSVVIEKGDMRYEVYFDKPSVFFGEPQEGQLVVFPDNKNGLHGKLEYWPNW